MGWMIPWLAMEDLSSSMSQLTANGKQRALLQGELEASKAKIATLESELASAQAQIGGGTNDDLVAEINRLNDNLASAVTELAGANTSIAQLNEEKSALQSQIDDIAAPRHFYSVEELNAWLAADDTNTNPDYALLGPAEKSFILQVRALRDGLLLPAAIDADNDHIYSWNVAVVGASIYVVTASTDETLFLANFQVPPAQRPLPLPSSP